MTTEVLSYLATGFFVISLLHTFCVSFFNTLASRFTPGSFLENVFHLLGEVEIVFGFWSFLFISLYALILGKSEAISYLNSRSYNEPVFVFVIMVTCSSKPVREIVNSLIAKTLQIPFLKPQVSFFFVALAFAPLLGSFITEPAAMTVIATLLLNVVFEKNRILERLKYGILGLLFVNISIGGTLTSYAAPAVLMVAQKWQWDLVFMANHFGWKAGLSCLTSTFIYFLIFKDSILKLNIEFPVQQKSPLWVQLISIGFIASIVVFHQELVVFGCLFMFFLGFVKVTSEYQDGLKIKESLLVGFFLVGLLVLGGLQNWWLEPFIAKVNSGVLFMASIALTAVTDNAALTYLGSLAEQISSESKYALVSGALIGGGLTVIANAPNPAGYGILNSQFGETGIKAGKLFLGALIPTAVAAIIFWVF